MSNKEAVNWLINVMADIGKVEHSDLWHYEQALMEIREMLESQPERKKGRWISADAMFHGVPFYCSECGENTRDTVMGTPRWKFCPMCGADMRRDEEK